MNLEWIINLINQLSKVKYTGKVEINFYLGGVSGINYTQSIKGGDQVRMVAVG